jgi:formamidopyrimidine-DNA glycosylase
VFNLYKFQFLNLSDNYIMPEVIEVKLYSDFIRDKCLGKEILGIAILGGRYKKHKPFAGYNKLIKELPLKVQSVETKGKYTTIKLGKDINMGITLGLSGGWVFQKKGVKKYIGGLEEFSEVSNYGKNAINHLNIEFKFSTGSLYFYDMLSFGTITILNDIDLEKKLKVIGPDMIHESTTFNIFKERIMKKKYGERLIGNLLMDQKVISGIGNYLRADGLWLAGISPFRKVENLSEKELKKLYSKLRLLIWGQYDYKEGVKKKIIKKGDKIPKDLGLMFFIYSAEKDPKGRKVIKEKLYEGSQIRYIYWVKEAQQ